MTLTKISVVLPTYNKAVQLKTTLRALTQQTVDRSDYEIIVVDNQSRDDTCSLVRAVQQSHRQVHYLFETRQGRSQARNAGISAAQGDIVLLLDDDILVSSDHLERYVALHSEHPQSIIMGYIIDCSPISPYFLQTYFRRKQTMGSSTVGAGLRALDYRYSRTGNMSVARAALEAAAIVRPDGRREYLDESLIRREDTELGYRLARQGLAFLFARDVVSFHFHPRTWKNVVREVYWSGYSLRALEERIPGVADHEKYLAQSRLANLLLFGAGAAAMPFALAIQSISPWLLNKSVSSLLAAVANQGYQHAASRHDRR
jgi:glycosyltransferase involved in cell wall biosynthesis